MHHFILDTVTGNLPLLELIHSVFEINNLQFESPRKRAWFDLKVEIDEGEMG